MKNIIIKFIGVLLLIFLFSCQEHIVKKNERVVNQDSDYSSSVIDIFDPWPFVIKRKTMYSVLPENLGGKNAKGMAVLSVNINKQGKIKIFTIIKLSIFEGERQIIDFYGLDSPLKLKKDYPSNVLRYFPFFEKYVNNLKIVPVVGVEPKSDNVFTFIVRF